MVSLTLSPVKQSVVERILIWYNQDIGRLEFTEDFI